MAKLNWTPWMGIDEIKDCMDQFMEQALENAARHEGGDRSCAWRPVADMYETNAACVFLIELPGVARRDVVLELKPRELQVYGRRRSGDDVERREYHMLERTYGAFARTFPLPEGVDASGARAVFDDGLLTVTLPKVDRSDSRRIEITTD